MYFTEYLAMGIKFYMMATYISVAVMCEIIVLYMWQCYY